MEEADSAEKKEGQSSNSDTDQSSDIMMPWKVVEKAPIGKRNLRDGAHGAVSVSDDGESVFKAVPRNSLGEMPYEFVMEVISRDRCSDISPEDSRIAPVEAVIETPRHYILQMRNIKGGDVWDMIKEGRAKNADVKAIIRDVLQALRVLHSRGVSHRDIKDANVLIEPGGGRAWLCDMSLATCGPHMVGDPFLPYTGRYRPPEVETYGERCNFEIDWFKADIYATGAFIARLVAGAIWGSKTGIHPPNRRELLKHMPEFTGKGVVLAMMDDDPDARPTADGAMLAFGFEAMPPVFPAPSVLLPLIPVDSGRLEISAMVKKKDFPRWLSEVACEIYQSLPAEEEGARARRICVAIAAKMCVMVREREVLGHKYISDHKGDVKRISGIVARNPGSRRAIHRLLRSDLPRHDF